MTDRDILVQEPAAPTAAMRSVQVGTTTGGLPRVEEAVQVTASALPAGAATEATLALIQTALGSLATDAVLQAVRNRLPAALAAHGGLAVEGVAGGVAMPMSAASLPLPAGAATQATLADVLAALLAGIAVSNLPATQPVSAASLPLPTGAATQTTLATLLTQADFDTKLAALIAAVQASGQTTVAVSNFPATQPISATSLPLPSGAATDAMVQAVRDRLPTALVGGRLDVNIGASQATVPTSVADGSNVTQGAKADAAATDSTSAWSAIALLKGLYAKLAGTLTVSGNVGVTSLPALSTGSNVIGGVTVANGADVAQGAVADAAATDSTSSWSVVALLKGVYARLAGTLTVGGSIVSVSTEFTRPADTTGYTAGDMVSDSTSATTMQQLTNVARVSGGSGYLVGARLSTDKKSIIPRFRVHLFNATGATLAVDNAAYESLYADIGKRVGYFDLPSMATPADTTNSTESRAIDLTIRVPFVCVASRNLYFVLETLDAFAPASGEKFTLSLVADLN